MYVKSLRETLWDEIV